MRRSQIPNRVASEVLAANRHTCCICRELHKDVQLHHIDGNPGNNAPRNLAVVCLDCHSKVTSDGGLGRAYTKEEIQIYKEAWQALNNGFARQQQSPHHSTSQSQIHGVITRLQSRKERVSVVVSESLELASKIGAAEVAQFCQKELSGWREKHDALSHPLPTYRMCPCFLSPVRLNITTGPWEGDSSNIWDFMSSRDDLFVNYKLFISFPLDRLEKVAHDASQNTQSVVVLTVPSKWAFPDSESTDSVVHFYIRQDALASVVDSIRSRLTLLLLELLPSSNVGSHFGTLDGLFPQRTAPRFGKPEVNSN